MMNLLWWPMSLGLVTSMILTPLTIILFKKMGWVVDPTKTPHPAHTHKTPVPKGGGLPILGGILVVAYFCLPIDKHLTAILLALALTITVGVIDDVKPLPPKLRLVTNLLAAMIVVSAGIGIAFVTNPLGGGVIDLTRPRIGIDLFGHHEIWLWPDIFALIWIPFVMNAVNWSSGTDGQASGVLAIAALIIGLLSLSYSADIAQWNVAILAFGLLGTLVPLTIFHFYPQQIMPGYGATTGVGLLLGVLSILSTTKIGTMIVVLGIPLIDAVYTIVRRISARKSPFLGDRGHLHHRMLERGWGKRRIALFYWTATGLLGMTALKFNAQTKLFAILGLVIWLYFGVYSKRPDRGSG